MLRDSRQGAIRLETRVSRLWFEYTALRDKAEKSRALQDGIAAGRAWARFIGEFLPANSCNGAAA